MIRDIINSTENTLEEVQNEVNERLFVYSTQSDDWHKTEAARNFKAMTELLKKYDDNMTAMLTAMRAYDKKYND